MDLDSARRMLKLISQEVDLAPRGRGRLLHLLRRRTVALHTGVGAQLCVSFDEISVVHCVAPAGGVSLPSVANTPFNG